MVGRDLQPPAARSSAPSRDVALDVRSLSRRGAFENVSFQLRRGEILGIAGLMGAGRTELVSAIAGLAPADSGEIVVANAPVRIRTPRHAMDRGIAMVTEDRKRFGVIPEMSVSENITLPALRRVSRGPIVNRAAATRIAAEQIGRFRIRTPGPAQRIKNLSGGNQQKALLARALLTDPSVLILDEPARGIDVGAKAEVYTLIQQLANEGKAILMVSSELPEILVLSDRILVMRQGRVAAELRPPAATAEQILKYAMPE